MRRHPARLSLLFLPILLLLFVAAPATAASDADPTLDGVRQMLKAKMSEDVIMQWVEASDPPRLPTAEEMVALRKAGAGDNLLSLILRRAGGAASTASESSKPTAEPSASARPAPKPALRAMAPAPIAKISRPDVKPVPSADGELVETSFKLSYSPYVPEDSEEWELYVYLDGKPLSYVPQGGVLGGKPLEFVRMMEPGSHRIRILQERHESSRRGVEHESRVSDLVLDFDIDPGQPAQIELRFDQTLLRSKNPLSYSVSQGRHFLSDEKVGGDPERWPELCEDVPATTGKRSRSTTQRLKSCVAWASLWPEGAATTRGDVLKALARFDYRPIPRRQTVH